MFADYHIHTSYSDDSECLMEDMIQKAILIGLEEISFTEHVDYGIRTDLNCNYEKYFEEIKGMQQKYNGKLRIRAGIEFGVQLHTMSLFQKDFEEYPFDFIILSNHQIGDKEFWNYKFQEGKSQEEYQRAYYQAILDVVENFKDYSVLGHLDMIKRYDPAGDYPDEKVIRIVDQILRQVILDGKGIEVNTSSFRYGLKDLTPSRAILKRYRELGGTVITIGSDSHKMDHLGAYIEDVKLVLKEIGFRQFSTFEEMKPVYWEL